MAGNPILAQAFAAGHATAPGRRVRQPMRFIAWALRNERAGAPSRTRLDDGRRTWNARGGRRCRLCAADLVRFDLQHAAQACWRVARLDFAAKASGKSPKNAAAEAGGLGFGYGRSAALPPREGQH